MNRFDFIGFHETRDVDVHRLGQAINLPLVASHYVNKTTSTSERDEAMADVSLRHQLSGLLLEDLKFYNQLRDRHQH